MRFLIVGGFLGAGKTSFILDLARYMVEKKGVGRVAIIENEIGEVGVDDKVLRGSGYFVKDMFAGCICCTLAGDLVVSVNELIEQQKPDWIIMETTGVAVPSLVADNLAGSLSIKARTCSIVDAKRWSKLLAKKSVADLLRPQLHGVDVIVINKADLVDGEKLEKVKHSVAEVNPAAAVVASSAKNGTDEAILRLMLEGE